VTFAAACAIAVAATPAGISGTVLLLPFQAARAGELLPGPRVFDLLVSIVLIPLGCAGWYWPGRHHPGPGTNIDRGQGHPGDVCGGAASSSRRDHGMRPRELTGHATGGGRVARHRRVIYDTGCNAPRT
jgi:hypothetical protein